MLPDVSSGLGILCEAGDVSMAFCCSLPSRWLPQTIAGISVPVWPSHTIPASAGSDTPSISHAHHRPARTPLIASTLVDPRCWLMTRMLCDLLITGQITKDKMSHLNIFPSLSFSFRSLPSSSSSFSPFLLARGRACEQREPGSHPVSTSPGLLPTPKGRRRRKARSWADHFPRAQGCSPLVTCSPRNLHACPTQREAAWIHLSCPA